MGINILGPQSEATKTPDGTTIPDVNVPNQIQNLINI
jgi:hypothetical protein